jgi:hypothetical protein
MRRPERRTTRPARIAELVGPPGSGKSSVFHALLERDPRIERRPGLPSLGAPVAVAGSVTTSLATLARNRAFDGRPYPEQVRMMAYLHAVPRIFADRRPKADRILVFDQGPLYLLSRPSLNGTSLRAWRERTIDDWACILSMVVVLDAPDETLAARINERAKWHRLKGTAETEAVGDIVAARRRYDALADAFAARPHAPELIRFDTSECTPDRIADEVLAALAAPRRAALARHAAGSL